MNCANCGQALLADDTECWQCGHPVAGAPKTVQSETPPVREQWQPEAEAETQVRPVVVYGIFTVVIICLALAVTIYLGRQPLVQAAVQLPPEGWAFISNRQRSFTTAVPETWALYDVDDSDLIEDAFTALLEGNPLIRAVTAPLGISVEDTRIIYVAGNVDPAGQLNDEAFLVVSRSTALNDLTVDELIARAAEGDVEINAAEYIEDFERTHVFLDVDIPPGEETGREDPLRCRQQIIPGITYTMIAVACGVDHNELRVILDDYFQRLD